MFLKKVINIKSGLATNISVVILTVQTYLKHLVQGTKLLHFTVQNTKTKHLNVLQG